MRPWSPLLVQKIELHALGFVLHTLRLNRHTAAEVAEHRHPFDQLILFLSGEGRQSVAGRRHAAAAGDLFVIPANTAHGFAPAGRQRRPVCLVLDYSGAQGARHRRLAPAEVDEIRRQLARVPNKGRLTLSAYPPVLEVVALLLESRARPAPPRLTWLPAVLEHLHGAGGIAAAARAAGRHRDHLTRELKKHGGLGLRALRDRQRLETARRALRTAATITDAAVAAGFDDPNYFARWFKRRTGRTPSQSRNREP